MRDTTLLECAVAAPKASFAGNPIISDPIEIAAAYLFYLCNNHPFVDGKKRVALASCLVFLDQNNLLIYFLTQRFQGKRGKALSWTSLPRDWTVREPLYDCGNYSVVEPRLFVVH